MFSVQILLGTLREASYRKAFTQPCILKVVVDRALAIALSRRGES